MPLPYAPRGAMYDPSDRSAAIVLRQGENAAEAARRSGQIWGGAIQNLGGIATDAVGQYQEQKAQQQISNNDKSLLTYLEQAGDKWDPLAIRKIVGPQRADKVIEGLVSYEGIRQKRGQEALQHLPGLVRGLNAVGEGGRAAMYAQIAPVVKQAGLFPAEAIPDQYDPQSWKGIADFVMGMEKPKEQALINVGPRGVYDPNQGKMVVDAEAPKVDPPKTREIEVRLPNGKIEKRIVEDKPGQVFTSESAPTNPKTENKIWVKRAGPDGKMAPIFVPESEVRPGDTPANERTEGRPATGVERKITSFFGRMKQADEDIERLESSLPTSLTGQARMEYAPNFLQSDVGQAYRTAQNQFTEARLRKDSGAAVPPHEYAADRQAYFPQPGDTPETIAQKRRARAALLANVARESGSGLREEYGDDADALIESYRVKAKGDSAPARTAPPNGNLPGPGAAGIITTPDGKKWKQVGGRMVEQR
jgi:hypothetical protein